MHVAPWSAPGGCPLVGGVFNEVLASGVWFGSCITFLFPL